QLKKEIAGSVNAQVFYDHDKISLSIFKNFPNISATIRDFGVVGNEPFQYDTLVHANEFQVDLNLKSILFDDTPKLTAVHLNGGCVLFNDLEAVIDHLVIADVTV